MYLIFWERGVWGVVLGGGGSGGVPGGRWSSGFEGGGSGLVGESIVKGMERDESRKQGMGEDRDGERRQGDNEGKGGGE